MRWHEAVAEKGIPVRIRSSPATVSGVQAIMSLTKVGKALTTMKLSQETCLLRSRKPTGDGLAFVRLKYVYVILKPPAIAGGFFLKGGLIFCQEKL